MMIPIRHMRPHVGFLWFCCFNGIVAGVTRDNREMAEQVSQLMDAVEGREQSLVQRTAGLQLHNLAIDGCAV